MMIECHSAFTAGCCHDKQKALLSVPSPLPRDADLALVFCQVGMWDASTNHYKKLIPLKQQISILARAVGVVNRYNRNKPSFTVYSWACLSGDKVSKWKAYLTFAVQVLLVTMLCLGMEVENFGTQVPLCTTC